MACARRYRFKRVVSSTCGSTSVSFRLGFLIDSRMTVATPPDLLTSPPAERVPDAPGWCAELDLRFERRGDSTVMVRAQHRGPLRVQKALYPEGRAVCHAILLHPPAGIVGGDSLVIDVSVGEGAHVLLTTPGAGKWYRSAGRIATMAQNLRVGAGAVCEFLPQESIVFDAAQGELASDIVLAPGASFIGAEMLCFGRTGSGERFSRGAFAMRTRISVGERPVWLERGRVEGGSGLLDAGVGLAGQPVVGTLLAVGPGVDEGLRDACREIVPVCGNGAVTLLPGVLVARWLGPSCEPGREWFARLWACMRPAVARQPMREPRIWRT